MVDLLTECRRFAKRHQLWHHGDRILVAWSGGLDSAVLVALLTELREKEGLELAVLHCNHGLRGEEADRDEQFVESQAAAMGLPYFVRYLPVAEFARRHRLSVQDSGHKLRYQTFGELRQSEGFTSVATGHHRNDQAETVLLHLLRGTGIVGMGGMRPKRGPVVRPLLFAAREQLAEYANSHSVQYVEDSSNQSDRYLRNRLRRELLPLLRRYNPRVEATLARSATIFAEASDYFEKKAEGIYRRAVQAVDEKKIVLAIRPLDDYLELFGHLLFHRVLTDLVGPDAIVGSEQVSQIQELVRNGLVGREIALGGGVRVLREREHVVFLRGRPEKVHLPVEPGETVEFHGQSFSTRVLLWQSDDFVKDDPWSQVVDYHLIRGRPLLLRSWKRGDRMVPLGMEGHKKLSDLFIDAKMPRYMKETTPIVECDGQIVWVCGVALSDRFKVTGQTAEVLQMRLSHHA